MPLHLHRADRTDLLADGLGTLLSTPPDDPFAEDLVLVSARGMERWLSQRLSHVLGVGSGDDGVCAGITFRHPASLVAELTGTADDDPWSPDAMVWPLLDVIDRSLDQPWCRTLAAHLGHFEHGEEQELRRGRRYAVARRLAGLFASYARQRPDLLVAWLEHRTDGLDPDLAWQPEIYRALVARADAAPPHIRHANAVAALKASPTDLPQRISLFGHTRLPVTDIELLCALSTHHDLHLWLPHPSDELWARLRGAQGAVPRREDTTHRDVGHPLLATLGRDLRELQRALPADPHTDESLGAAARPDTLLGWLQSDIAANAVRPAGRTRGDDDRSVQVHSCHGPGRQIDVLREVLLGLLVDDPTLEPRDILVMCPDIETYAPLLVADFGLGDVVRGAHPAHRLRVQLADRALTQTNPLLGVAGQLLAMAGGRATASEVLNLAEAAPVRHRFGFTDDDLNIIGSWVRQANIRWGFDRESRVSYGVDFVQNTWRFGVDRVLAGVAMSDESTGLLPTTLALDDVGSNHVDLAGRLAEFVQRLQKSIESLCAAQPLTQWTAALHSAIAALTEVPDADSWQATQLEREFADILHQAGEHRDAVLRVSDLKALLGHRLAGRPTRANFRTGTLTVCTMVPMRSVPHRVVCLVGLDDGVFPRLGVVDGDDALARDPMTGERDIRTEDRQLLLDAIGAATDKLVITYTGFSESSGQRRPPAVPLSELLDALDATTTVPVRKAVLTSHPLQPFDVRNVQRGELGVRDKPFTFDPTVLTAARALAGERSAPRQFVPAEPLPAPPPSDIAIEDLVAFFRDPVKGFFQALEFTLPWDVDGVQDTMPVEIDNLEQWSVGDRLLSDLLRGVDARTAARTEWCRGTLPPGKLGWRKVKSILEQAERIAVTTSEQRNADPDAHDVDLELSASRRLTGTIYPVYGDRTVTAWYSKLGPKHVIESWIRLLALAAGTPGAWSAVCVGRASSTSSVACRLFAAPPDPTAVLRDLVDLYDAGRREPLPLPVKTSYDWAEARFKGRDPMTKAKSRWEGGPFFDGDRAERAHVQVWDRYASFDVLLGPPRDGERVNGEDTRLGALAARLWSPLLDAEQKRPRRRSR